MERSENITGDTLFEIQEQVINLSQQWKDYIEIFQSENTPVIYETSPLFFHHLKKILQGNIVITITKLFDKADKKDRKGNVISHNICFDYLIDQLIEEKFPEVEIDNLSDQINKFRLDNNGSLFRYRNKLLAHNDYPTIQEENYQNFTQSYFSISDLNTSIRFITSLTNELVCLALQKVPPSINFRSIYAHPYMIDFDGVNSDADKLLVLLKKAFELKNKWFKK